MNILVTYHSVSGNTKRVAQAIHKTLPSAVLLPLEEARDPGAFDLLFIGFPVHEFGPSREAAAFISALKGKKMALFLTHAMKKEMPLYQPIIERCRRITRDNQLLGLYSCRGELSREIADQMLNAEDEKIKAFGRMRDLTLHHPDEEELQAAALFAGDIIKSLG